MGLKENEIVTVLWRGGLFVLMVLISTLPIGVTEERGLIWKVCVPYNCHVYSLCSFHAASTDIDSLLFLDRYAIEYMGATSKDSKKSKPITWLAVFDGHGGAEASQFCSDWLSSYVRKDKEYPSSIHTAMKSAFTKVSCFISFLC